MWLLAALLAACSTHIQLSTQAGSHIHVGEPASSKTTTIQGKISAQTTVLHRAEQRKQQFFSLMKPVVMAENEHMAQLRQQLIQFKALSRPNRQQQAWLQKVAGQYGLTFTKPLSYEDWQALLARVDIVPLEMALVQAANESAWGTSRFARQGNNYFGQWCYHKGCGLVPKQRAAGASHEVKRFDNVQQSVRAYMHNINTSPAYAEFRSIRHSLRVQSRPLNAQLLVIGLKFYSERGMDYVRTIQSMMRSNRTLIQQS